MGRALETMRASHYNAKGCKWAVYENQDIGHSQCGHLKFLAVGSPENTYQEAPARLPDMPNEINWRYVLVGYVKLETGEIENIKSNEN